MVKVIQDLGEDTRCTFIDGKIVVVKLQSTEDLDDKSLLDEAPSIQLSIDGKRVLFMTWEECRALISMLSNIVDIAEFG